jgi:multidrug efflux pump subunit AcrA (membrane-fusion protein)
MAEPRPSSIDLPPLNSDAGVRSSTNQVEIRVEPQRPKEAQARGALDLLLKIEADARRAATTSELSFIAANETLKITRCRQIFVLRRHGGKMRVDCVSSVGKVERNSPRIRWIEAIVKNLSDDAGLSTAREFTLPAYCPNGDEEHKTFPFRFIAWLPFALPSGQVFGGMLFAREIPWTEADMVVAGRLCETYGHAWAALTGKRRLNRRTRLALFLWTGGLALLVAAGFYPVPMAVLAPVEVSAIEPVTVAAPLDGIIGTVSVVPNQPVKKGDIVVRLSDVGFRNDLEVAERDVSVANARLKRVTLAAVNDFKARSELAEARAELALAEAKRDYARDLLARSSIPAPADGVAVFTDARDLTGRPVQTGQRILDIADPAQTELRIDVPVADAIALKTGARVRAFLDSDPLTPIDAEVVSASYEATEAKGVGLAYRVRARLAGEAQADYRLGTRGTAQILGDKVPLAFYLLRRPLSALRQSFGL